MTDDDLMTSSRTRRWVRNREKELNKARVWSVGRGAWKNYLFPIQLVSKGVMVIGKKKTEVLGDGHGTGERKS